MPESDELSPDAAAEIVGMSRVMLLHGLKVGSIKSLRHADVIAFKERYQREREAMAEFSRLIDEEAMAASDRQSED
ncbi:hypothetical protein HPT29_027750 (plasmid) [Microvirga terrae]|uniref:Helix-turn-helix domain-containing protein n=1 Tax=Microvirga terrae TaxID=2740529 RepID=A0ABY5RZZ1_9HYPH|nr:hypothetical protein [Microvirga terrae]UVF22816.1 hypothetical protein HPT29_027750 [Microvirga terrae]